MVKIILSKGLSVAIIAIDPSSPFNGGSILGDKTRMSEISKSENTFIRSTPSRGSLGGVSFGTREAAIILDSAGYDFIFIESWWLSLSPEYGYATAATMRNC